MDIEDQHPLRERAKLVHILDFCGYCLSYQKKKPNFKFALRQSLMAEMGIKVPKSEEQLIEDPFLILGYGINAYFDVMFQLCLMFFTISLFFIPVFSWYKYNPQRALASESPNPFRQLQSYTIGNMGGSQVICQQKKLNVKSMTFECPPGTDIDYSNIIYGIMSPKLDLSYYCTEEAILASSGNDDKDKCTRYINTRFVLDQLNECKA